MMRAMDWIRVGCAGFRGSPAKYWAQGLDVRELTPAESHARPRTLRRWREAAPPAARFVPTADPALARARFAGEEARASWARTLQAVEHLEADTVLLPTPADFRPTRENRAALLAFARSARPSGLRLAWRAEGLWETQPEDRDALCAEGDLIPVVDPLHVDEEAGETLPPGEHVYWRLLGGPGMGVRFSDDDLDRLLAACAGRAGGYVIFGAPQMLRDARRFRVLLAAASGEADAGG